MIGNNYAFEMVAVKDRENAKHVHIAFVDEGLAIVRDLSHNVA